MQNSLGFSNDLETLKDWKKETNAAVLVQTRYHSNSTVEVGVGA